MYQTFNLNNIDSDIDLLHKLLNVNYHTIIIIPHDEHRSSGPRSVKLCSEQKIFQFLFRTMPLLNPFSKKKHFAMVHMHQ